MIKAIIFDLGGVLIRQRPAEEWRALAEHFGLSPDELVSRLFGGGEWRQACVGAISDDEFWRRVGSKLGLETPGQIQGLQQMLFDRERERLDRELLSLVNQLQQRCQVAALSNATDCLAEVLEKKLDIAHLFDLVVNSAYVGLAKPDPAIYELTLARLGVAPQEVVFVDDKVGNVTSAARLGIRAVHHVTRERTVAQIRALLEESRLEMLVDVPLPEDYAGMLAISQAMAKEDWWGAVLMLAQPETTADVVVLCDDPGNRLLVARAGGQVVGMGLLMQPTPGVIHHTAELSVAVHPGYRRRGVARRLSEMLLRAGARQGVQLARAWVSSVNGAACALAERLGFQEMARLTNEFERTDGRRFDEVVYSKEVADA